MGRFYFFIRQGYIQLRVLIILIFPLLVSCAALTPQTTVVRTIDVEPVAESENVLAANFELLGRASVRNAHQRFSGTVHWLHSAQEDIILLRSPLGQVVAEINRYPRGVTLVTSRKEVFHARDVEDLTADVLGWRLPLKGLQFWIQGHYSPASAASIDIDREDRIVAIRQDGWQVQFIRFFVSGPEKPARPRIIKLQFEDLNIRMVIDDWVVV